MDATATKTCPLCCETINAKARKCPHCLHFQNKLTMICFHPLTATIPMALSIIAFAMLMDKLFAPGEDFEAHRGQIRVLQSTMQFGERTIALPAGAGASTSGPTVAVVGTVENDSGIPWKNAVIEARFFDKDHKLIDARQETVYEDVLTPGQPNAFKVSMQREFSADKYASHEVRVVYAHDARRFFP